MKKKQKWAGYVRVSTKGQEERGESLKVQTARLRKHAEEEDWDLTICPEAKSAKDEKHRPKFQSLLADLEAGRMDGLVATTLDRLWRNFDEQRIGINLIHDKWRRAVKTLDGEVDMKTPSGRLITGLRGLVAQHEREKTGERVTHAMLHRAKNGLWNGGPTPYGYRLIPVATGERKLNPVINEEEAEVLRQISTVFLLDRRTIRGTCHAMNEAGYRTREGEQWANQTIRRLLTSTIYTGELIYNRRDTTNDKTKQRAEAEHIRVAGALPAIIGVEMFNEVQKMLAARPRFQSRGRVAQNLLAGLVKCEACGGNMSGQAMFGSRDRRLPEEKRGQRHRYYRCFNYVQKGKTACTGQGVRADVVEANVVRSLFSLRVDAGRLRKLVDEQQGRDQAAAKVEQREVCRLEQALKKIEKRDARIKVGFAQGLYSMEEAKEQRHNAAEEQTRIGDSLEKAKALVSTRKELFNVEGWLQKMVWMEDMKTAKDFFDSYDFEWRRRLIQDMIEKVVVGPSGGYFLLRDLKEWKGLFIHEGPTQRTIRPDIPLPVSRRAGKGAGKVPKKAVKEPILVSHDIHARADI